MVPYPGRYPTRLVVVFMPVDNMERVGIGPPGV